MEDVDSSLILLLAEEVAEKTAYLTDALFMLEHDFRGSCNTPFREKFALSNADSISEKSPTHSSMPDFSKIESASKSSNFSFESEFCKSLSVSKEAVLPLMQATHALKGAFRAVSCLDLATLMHSCEDAISQLPLTHDFEPIYWILNRISILQDATAENFQTLVASIVSKKDMQQVAEVPTLRLEMERFKQLLRLGLAVRAKKSQEKQISEEEEMLLEELFQIALRPIQTIVPHLKRLVRDVATKELKEVTLEIQGDEIRCDAILLQKLIPMSGHLVTNAIFHGIEKKEERLKNGKSPIGTLRMSFAERDDRLVVTFSDDGAGIDIEELKKRAQEMDIPLPQNPLDLVFHPNFSTAKKVTLSAGRGEGLGICKTFCESLGGKCTLTSFPGKGTSVELILPLSLLVQKLCVVRVGEIVYGIPLCSVVQIEREGAKYAVRMDDGSHFPIDASVGVEEVVLSLAGTLLGNHPFVSHIGIDGEGTIMYVCKRPSAKKRILQIGNATLPSNISPEEYLVDCADDVLFVKTLLSLNHYEESYGTISH